MTVLLGAAVLVWLAGAWLAGVAGSPVVPVAVVVPSQGGPGDQPSGGAPKPSPAASKPSEGGNSGSANTDSPKQSPPPSQASKPDQGQGSGAQGTEKPQQAAPQNAPNTDGNRAEAPKPPARPAVGSGDPGTGDTRMRKVSMTAAPQPGETGGTETPRGGQQPQRPGPECQSGCDGQPPNPPPGQTPGSSAGTGGGANGPGGSGGQTGTEDGTLFNSYMHTVNGPNPQQPDGQVVKNKDPRTGTDPPTGSTPFPNALPQKPQPDQPGTGSQDCAAGGCATSPVPGVKTPDADTSAETAGLTDDQKQLYGIGLSEAQDRNKFTELVPGYNPSVAPTREQIIQAGVETRRLNQEVRDANGVGEDPGAAQRLVPRVPDTHEVFGRLSDVPFPQIGTAAALTNAYAYHKEGKDKEAAEALAAGIPLAGKLGLLAKGGKLAGKLGEGEAKPTPPAGKPTDTAPAPAATPTPPGRVIPRPEPGQPAPGAGKPAPKPAGRGDQTGPAGPAGTAPGGRTTKGTTGRGDNTPAMSGAPSKGKPSTASGNSNRNTPDVTTPRTTGSGRGTTPRDTAGSTPPRNPSPRQGRPQEPEQGPAVGAKLPETGSSNPKAIRFSQSSIKGTFRDGRTVKDLAEGLRSGSIDPAKVPPIRLVERDGQLYTLDNRRLAAFQEAGVDVPYRMATPKEIARDGFKFTTKNEGKSIKIRGGFR